MPRPIQLSPDEISAAFSDERWSEEFPPIMTLAQVAKLFQISIRTAKYRLTDGKFDQAILAPAEKHPRFWRNRLIKIASDQFRIKCTESTDTY